MLSVGLVFSVEVELFSVDFEDSHEAVVRDDSVFSVDSLLPVGNSELQEIIVMHKITHSRTNNKFFIVICLLRFNKAGGRSKRGIINIGI